MNAYSATSVAIHEDYPTRATEPDWLGLVEKIKPNWSEIVKEFNPTLYKPKYISDIRKIPNIKQYISEDKIKKLEKVTQELLLFRANEYYLNLINWNDPEDPIRRLVFPVAEELEDTLPLYNKLDASNEQKYQVLPGAEHKYPDTLLFLCSPTCGSYCRYCFRKGPLMKAEEAASIAKKSDADAIYQYIREHPEINNVLLTGGDPLILGAQKLDEILTVLRSIPHVRTIRIGTKVPAFNPYQILSEPQLVEVLAKHSLVDKKIYIMAHFTHPREITPQAKAALVLLQKAGLSIVNQAPIIKGINDKAAILRELFKELSFIGVQPYYMFICRPTKGNETFAVTVEEAAGEFFRALQSLSGLEKRPRLVMSHETGKLHVLDKTKDFIFFRYHRAADKDNVGRTLIYRSDPTARWLEDYSTKQEPFISEQGSLKHDLLRISHK